MENDNPNYKEDSLISNLSLLSLVKLNKYVIDSQNKKSLSGSSFSSLSYLVDMIITQGQKIKLGCAVEKILWDIILTSNCINMKQKNVKGDKECDHLCRIGNVIYYAEIKCNLNLDTEKTKATIGKCKKIQKKLTLEYPDCEVKMFLVSGRFIEKKDIPKNIIIKFKSIDANVVGVNEYLQQFGIHLFADESAYRIFINTIVKEMFAFYANIFIYEYNRELSVRQMFYVLIYNR